MTTEETPPQGPFVERTGPGDTRTFPERHPWIPPAETGYFVSLTAARSLLEYLEPDTLQRFQVWAMWQPFEAIDMHTGNHPETEHAAVEGNQRGVHRYAGQEPAALTHAAGRGMEPRAAGAGPVFAGGEQRRALCRARSRRHAGSALPHLAHGVHAASSDA